VRLDQLVACSAGAVRVDAERAHPERAPDRVEQPARVGDGVDLVEARDARPADVV
jgi:hypothetical protein